MGEPSVSLSLTPTDFRAPSVDPGLSPPAGVGVIISSAPVQATPIADSERYVVPHTKKWKIELIGLQLFLGQAPFMAAIRLPCRVISLISGDFVRAGYEIGNEKWELASLAAQQRLNRNTFIAKEIIKQLVINIVQIVTYPLAIIALQFAALTMMISRNHGRKFWATVEHAWSRNEALSYKIILRPTVLFQYLDYLAFCMQPKTIWDQRIIYQHKARFNNWREETLTSRMLVLKNYIAKYQSAATEESLKKEFDKTETLLEESKKLNTIEDTTQVSYAITPSQFANDKREPTLKKLAEQADLVHLKTLELKTSVQKSLNNLPA